MHDMVQKVAQYKIYSTLDTSSAYHQLKIPACDRIYTAFQAEGCFGNGKEFLSDSRMESHVSKGLLMK